MLMDFLRLNIGAVNLTVKGSVYLILDFLAGTTVFLRGQIPHIRGFKFLVPNTQYLVAPGRTHHSSGTTSSSGNGNSNDISSEDFREGAFARFLMNRLLDLIRRSISAAGTPHR